MKAGNEKRILSLVVATAMITTLGCGGSSKQTTSTTPQAIDTGKAAGIGALLGLALGRSVWDVAGGAALGAAGGMIANEVVRSQHEKEQRQADSARAETTAREAHKLNSEERQAKQKFIDAVGEDNWNGYIALVGCDHDRAHALAQVGRTSRNQDYRITSWWLEAMVAVDERDTARADELFGTLVKLDPDIDTVQQARLAADKAH